MPVTVVRTPKIAILLLQVLVVLRSPVFFGSAQQLTVTARLHFNEGEPRKGAFCSDEEKHLILNVITNHLVEAQGDKIDKKSYDEWCTTTCYPSTILFCELMTKQCREMKTTSPHQRLLAKEIESSSTIDVDLADHGEKATSLVVFGEVDEPNRKVSGQLRRNLQMKRITEILTNEQELVCNEIKRILTRKISNELGSMVDTLCVRLLRQKLALDCVVFG